MAATYNLFRNPGHGEDEKNSKLHARLVKQTTIRIDRLVEEISQISSFSSADVKGLLEAFRSRMEFHLSCGDIIELEGLGTFNVSLKCPPLTDEKKIVPSLVRFSKVNFRCSGLLKNKLKNMRFERDSSGSRLKGFSPERRKQNILAYIRTYGTISTKECCSINGCSKHMALKDLKNLVLEQKIVRRGLRHNTHYGLKE